MVYTSKHYIQANQFSHSTEDNAGSSDLRYHHTSSELNVRSLLHQLSDLAIGINGLMKSSIRSRVRRSYLHLSQIKETITPEQNREKHCDFIIMRGQRLTLGGNTILVLMQQRVTSQPDSPRKPRLRRVPRE